MTNIQITTETKTISRIVRDEHGRYSIPRPGVTAEEILDLASEIAAEKLHGGMFVESPEQAEKVIQHYFGNPENEQFAVLWMDTKHKVLAFDVLFHGTIDGASVYPREVVKAALKHNSASCLLIHNHPSGSTEPSSADRLLTERLKEALAIVDVRVLDHFIIGHNVYSFAKAGIL
ncbi:MAG: JAB domain-containing protein [Thiopseudomonas sp.]